MLSGACGASNRRPGSRWRDRRSCHPELADKINRDVAQILHDPAVREELDKLLLEPVVGTRAKTVEFFTAERSLWRQVIAEAGIQAE